MDLGNLTANLGRTIYWPDIVVARTITLRNSKTRLIALVTLGVVSICSGFVVRNSRWAAERRLKAMSVDELALATRDSATDPLTFAYYGASLLAAGDAAAGEQAFRQALRLDSTMVKARLGLATALMRQGKIRSASEAYSEAIKADPKNPDAYMGLAQAYYTAGSSKRAIEPLEQVVKLRPSNATAWYALGRMYGSSHEWDRSYNALQQCSKIDPSNADCWRELAQVSYQYNRLPEAEQQCAKAIKLRPSDAVPYYLMGKIYSGMGDDARLRGKAEQCLVSATARDPELGPAYFELAQLYERSNNLPMAEANYRKSVALDPSDDQALYRLGLCQVKRGNAAEGQKAIRGAQELGAAKRELANLKNRCILEPNNRELRLRLARLNRKYGNDEGALQAYQDYQRMGPPDSAAEKEISELTHQMSRNRPAPRVSTQNPRSPSDTANP